MRGKVLLRSSGDIREWDHPRMCGEKLYAERGSSMPRGSPPHVRGKVAIWYVFFIVGQDHPRMCGEKLKFIAALFSMWGSPPHVRGKEC